MAVDGPLPRHSDALRAQRLQVLRSAIALALKLYAIVYVLRWARASSWWVALTLRCSRWTQTAAMHAVTAGFWT